MKGNAFWGILYAGLGFWATVLNVNVVFKPANMYVVTISLILGFVTSILMFHGIALIYLAKRD